MLWWPRGIERVSNSSRHSLEGAGSNPAWDQIITEIISDNFIVTNCVKYEMHEARIETCN